MVVVIEFVWLRCMLIVLITSLLVFILVLEVWVMIVVCGFLRSGFLCFCAFADLLTTFCLFACFANWLLRLWLCISCFDVGLACGNSVVLVVFVCLGLWFCLVLCSC